MNRTALILSAVIACVIFGVAKQISAADFISDKYQPGEFKLFADGTAADIIFDDGDFRVVRIAAEALAADIELVTGVKPAVINSSGSTSKQVVVIGTIEKSGLIKELIANKKLDISQINGKWETFLITVVKAPFPGVEAALVVAGSDRRGAAFGAFEISRQAGVSPWVWWADVTPDKKDSLIFKNESGVFGPPSVKYRGIFLNDEDFGLKPWAAETFEPETGDIGPKTYAKIFELLLRLKANHIWPAMHNCTRAFNYYESNKFVADDYAIVMGSSHCEQMLRNNVDEWKYQTHGSWSYLENKENLLRYWEDRVEANGKFENVYTIGMRAIHDSGMPDGKTTEERVSILDMIIKDQRAMLAKWVDPDVTKVPQVFIPYKEVLEIYWGGLKVPEDVTLVWPDDNFGYIRRLSTPDEQKRPGGAGVYYHISYWGPPHDYLWLDTTPPALIWEEMRKAWDYNARKVWMINVGDIKPQEIGIELFLQMAWDIDRWDSGNIDKFLTDWAGREFGAEFAAETASILHQYYILNYHRKPEHMGFYDKYSILARNNDPEYSLFNYGDEAGKRIDAFDEIEIRAGNLYEKIPGTKKDAYYQLVLYPVQASSLLNKKHLYAYKSRAFARQDRTSANDYARKTVDSFRQLQEETKYYNETMSGGRWKGMMDDSPNDLPVFDKVQIGSVKPMEGAEPGVQIEGRPKPLLPEDGDDTEGNKTGGALPLFNRFTAKRYYIDIFNMGSESFDWRAVPGDDWILLSEDSGTIETEKRVFVEIDYNRAPKGEKIRSNIDITGAGKTFRIHIGVFNPDSIQLGEGVFVQDNGVIAVNAGSFRDSRDAAGAGWRSIPGLGRTGSAISILPPTAPSYDNMQAAKNAAPVAEYPINVFSPGEAEIIVEAIPTHEIHAGRKLRVGISIDDGDIVPVDFEQAHEEVDEIGKINVTRNMMSGTAAMNFETGAHTLKLWGLDPSVIPDRIIIDFGGLRKSYLGPEETSVEKQK